MAENDAPALAGGRMTDVEFERLGDHIVGLLGRPSASEFVAEARRARIENEAKRLQIETLFRVRDELQERVESLKTEVATLKVKLAEAEKKNEEHRFAHTKLDGVFKRLKARADAAETSLEQERKHLHALRLRNGEIYRAMNAAETKLAGWAEAVKAIRTTTPEMGDTPLAVTASYALRVLECDEQKARADAAEADRRVLAEAVKWAAMCPECASEECDPNEHEEMCKDCLDTMLKARAALAAVERGRDHA